MTLRTVAEPARPPGVRVVLDARPLQDPGRAPVTAAYLASLLGAFDQRPLPGESFALLLRSDLDDPTQGLDHLEIVGRRLLPPTGLLRSAAQTLDPFLLRGAALGAAWRAERRGAHGAVYHAVGAGTLPIASGLPLVVTILDLAPWELPETFANAAAARFGHRLRSRLMRDAAALIVGTEAVARSARHLLHVRPERVHVVPIAPRPAFAAPLSDSAGETAGESPTDGDDAVRLGLGPRYLVYTGRYDARQDLATLLGALAALAAAGRPAGLPDDVTWPPRVLLVGASPDDRASLARNAARQGVGDILAYAPALSEPRLATLLRGARAALLPVLSDSTGLAAIESMATGTPVVASAVGAIPELVGPAGLLVPPGDVDRLAIALRTIWADDQVHDGITAATRERAATERRTWSQVAEATRAVYAAVGVRAASEPTGSRSRPQD